MEKTLGGCLFIRNGEKYDYCYKEAIQCLLEFCDKVVVCVVPTEDETIDNVCAFKLHYKDSVLIRTVSDKYWNVMDFHSKHRLSIFTNYAIEMLDTDYVFSLQGD